VKGTNVGNNKKSRDRTKEIEEVRERAIKGQRKKEKKRKLNVVCEKFIQISGMILKMKHADVIASGV
jgi:hypothetical protein